MMDWFLNLKTGKKLYLSFGILILILFTVILVSYYSLNELKKNNKTMVTQKVLFLEKLLELRDAQSDALTNLFLLSLSNSELETKKLLDEIKESSKKEDVLLGDIKELQRFYPELQSKIENIETMEKELKNFKEERVLPLVMNNKKKEALELVKTAGFQKYDFLGNQTVGLIDEVRLQLEKSMADADLKVSRAIELFMVLGISSVLIVLFMVSILNKQIVIPLQELTASAEAFSKGDINVKKLKVHDRKDEVGVLASVFFEMSNWLKNISDIAIRISSGDLTAEPKLQSEKDTLGNAFKTMINNLRKLTHETASGIHSLETSANQISSATAQLSSSSSETATAISETTTTIEEVKQTSHLANQKAKLISETAQKVNEVSHEGQKAANDIHKMMEDIQTQMNLIAESMLRLSEQNQAIGSIIETVEDMAQQSNLLSVNASIEAAKAGEQGRGFAIVAQEVKSLANQSKQATNQVREILGDIQKAASHAVMATEQGSKSVDSAVKKSEEARQSILSLVAAVSGSAKDALQISTTAHEQLVGMEQAAIAMENIKQATYQNVEGSKQLEMAAKLLKELGLNLKGLISQYKIKKEHSNDE